MLSMNDLKQGVIIELDGEPYKVTQAHHLKVAQRRPVMQTALKNLKTGKTLERTFQQSDKIPEADIKKTAAVFKYRTRTDFVFAAENGREFKFSAEDIGQAVNYLSKGIGATIVLFEDEPITVELPIKVVLEVVDAPPAARGDTVQGGNKEVKLESGGTAKTPLFINSGDKIEINTETGEYVRRVN